MHAIFFSFLQKCSPHGNHKHKSSCIRSSQGEFVLPQGPWGGACVLDLGVYVCVHVFD